MSSIPTAKVVPLCPLFLFSSSQEFPQKVTVRSEQNGEYRGLTTRNVIFYHKNYVVTDLFHCLEGYFIIYNICHKTG